MGLLDNKVCLITGAAQGIGKGIAERMAAEGAKVAANGRIDDDRLRAVTAETGAFAAPGDIADPVAMDAMVAAVEAEFGYVDALVCNAARMTMMPFLKQQPDRWWEQIDVNLSGHMQLITRVLPGMRERGRGWIVLISSLWGPIGWENASGYASTKSALISLGRSLGRELAPEGIYCSVVAPGIIDTPQLQVDADDAGVPLEEMHRLYAKNIPAGRIGTPADIAAAVTFLCTDVAAAYVGQVIDPNGGEIRCSM